LPLADLYKNQIRQLAGHLDILESIVEKAPSGGLWSGQTDEGELGIDYDTLDLILSGMDEEMSKEDITEALKVDLATVQGDFRRVKADEHKRRLPTVLRLRTASE